MCLPGHAGPHFQPMVDVQAPGSFFLHPWLLPALTELET